ncbi:chemotaxis protein CheW [Thiothrix lacustris]|uniref:chemotaxis protein CheW n=1 Tax=Thiothrix lacustris TaxID=525917 RepID=UPI0027E3F164|nr:chemotaxis protein CheW [Thiothrix lacustris]WMP16618.1 chemotaxis protein CheW [Thiothrix lacustris]
MQTSSESVASRFYYLINTHAILLETDVRAEVLSGQAICPLPFAPTWCAGLISLRGELYPVVNMHQVLQGQSFTNTPQLLLIQHPRFSPIILTCDGYPRQLKLPTQDLELQVSENLPSWIPHILPHNNNTLLVADHGRLLRHLQRTQGS